MFVCDFFKLVNAGKHVAFKETKTRFKPNLVIFLTYEPKIIKYEATYTKVKIHPTLSTVKN